MDHKADDQTYSVFNVDEFIAKTVGRRKPPPPFSTKAFGREAMIRARELYGGIRIPRGTYRFKTHGEADEWMIQKITQWAAKS
jgi:hypothetical protein